MEVWSRKEILDMLYEKEVSLGMFYSLRTQCLESQNKELRFFIEKNINIEERELRCLREMLT